MKRSIVIFLLLFLVSLATATPLLEFQHEQIQSGETIIATISTTGEFIKQIEQSDITFYEGRRQVSFESDIIFYNGTHYLYIYTTRQGNFSIQVANILYEENNELKSITITKSFNVTDEIIKEALSIKPGFVFTAGTPTIKLINRGTVTLNLVHGEDELSLEPLTFQQVALTPSQTFSYFDVSSYKSFSIPIIYLSANNPSTNLTANTTSTNTTSTNSSANATYFNATTNVTLVNSTINTTLVNLTANISFVNLTANISFESPSIQHSLRAEPELLLAELFTSAKIKKMIQLFNFGDENLTEIQATSDISFVGIGQLEDMPIRGVQDLILNLAPETSGHFQGHVNITYTQNETQYTISIPLSLFVLPEGNTMEDFEISEETCEEKSGTVCQLDEGCEGKTTFTKNSKACCLGICQPIAKDKPEGDYGWLIALGIFIVLGAGGYYLYKKQKAMVPKSSEDRLKEVSEKFKKRMTGTSETKRISGGVMRS